MQHGKTDGNLAFGAMLWLILNGIPTFGVGKCVFSLEHFGGSEKGHLKSNAF